MAERGNLFDDIKRDENLPIEDIIKSSKPQTEIKEETIETPADEEVKEENLSPLEQLKRSKETEMHGMVVSDEDLKEKVPSSDIVNTQERINEYEKAISDLDETAKKRNAVTVIIQPVTQEEYVQMMIEINSVTFDMEGKASFADGMTPKFVKIRGENDEPFDAESIKKNNPNLAESIEKMENKDGEETASNEAESKNPEEEEKEKKKKETVSLLIDKTGYGIDFLFSDEEKKAIENAEVLRINEVKTIDLNAIKSKRNQKSFQDTITEYGTAGSRVSICFPGSGFRAQMKGLTYGEYTDIALSMDRVTVDQYRKRLTVIYNKMFDISTGPFVDFEDFLKHFAYTDISLAIYALFVATEPENTEILLHCGNKACNKSFNWKYATRSILRLDKCSDNVLEKMKTLATSDLGEAEKIRDSAAVNSNFTIELPDSKFIVDVGVASAYDFLYNFVPMLDENTFKEAFGDEMNEAYLNNIVLLTAVRAIYIPDGNGEYTECIGYKDILDAIYHVSPREIQILAAYASKMQEDYSITFAFGGVKCPYCGNITENLEIQIDDLVFQTYQRLMSTEVDLNSIRGF